MTETVLLHKSMDWFLYDNGIRHERVNGYLGSFNIPLKLQIQNMGFFRLYQQSQFKITGSIAFHFRGIKVVNKLLPLEFYRYVSGS